MTWAGFGLRRSIWAGVLLLQILFVSPRAEAQRLPESDRYLGSEQIAAMMEVSTRWSPRVGRPNYPSIMKGWRVRLDNVWLSTIFDHPFFLFIESAAIASLRNYGEANSDRALGNKKSAEKAADDVAKNFFRRVICEPINERWMPINMGIDLDIDFGKRIVDRSDPSKERARAGTTTTVTLRFNIEF